MVKEMATKTVSPAHNSISMKAAWCLKPKTGPLPQQEAL